MQFNLFFLAHFEVELLLSPAQMFMNSPRNITGNNNNNDLNNNYNQNNIYYGNYY